MQVIVERTALFFCVMHAVRLYFFCTFSYTIDAAAVHECGCEYFVCRGELTVAVNLKKGQKIDLTKTNPGLKKLLVGLGWDVNKYDGGGDFDLDAAAFLLGTDGKAKGEQNFVFYSNLQDPSGAVAHTGDNRTGAGDGDDEVLRVNLPAVPADVDKIDFTVTIYEAAERGQNFGQVSNAYIRVVNEETGEELVHFDLGEDFSIETAVVVGELYRNAGEWKFNAVGSGYEGGLPALCRQYGLEA